jgi:hypothetical protein
MEREVERRGCNQGARAIEQDESARHQLARIAQPFLLARRTRPCSGPSFHASLRFAPCPLSPETVPIAGKARGCAVSDVKAAFIPPASSEMDRLSRKLREGNSPDKSARA